MNRTKITNVRPAGPNHRVVTVTKRDAGGFSYRREPCAECPWRADLPTGVFPAEAYRISADTAYDMAGNTFACHVSGGNKPATCAGFLLSQGAHNMRVRMKAAAGHFDPKAVSSPVPLYPNYRAMAVANGVDPADPVLAPCRDDGAFK